MNPEKRTLQVRVDDQVLADELFTTLMEILWNRGANLSEANALDFREAIRCLLRSEALSGTALGIARRR